MFRTVGVFFIAAWPMKNFLFSIEHSNNQSDLSASDKGFLFIHPGPSCRIPRSKKADWAHSCHVTGRDRNDFSRAGKQSLHCSVSSFLQQQQKHYGGLAFVVRVHIHEIICHQGKTLFTYSITETKITIQGNIIFWFWK